MSRSVSPRRPSRSDKRATTTPARTRQLERHTPADERKEAEKQIGRWIDDCEAPQVTMGPGGRPIHDGDAGAFLVKMAQATGTGSAQLQNILAMAVAKAMGCAEDQGEKPYIDRLNAALAIMHAIGRQTPVEGMLGAQMAVAHAMSMRAADFACWSHDTEVKRGWAALSVKFMKTFCTQVETLERLRGRGGSTQTVRVEHVTVEAGGQAIVGAISPGRGEGWNTKPRNDPMRHDAAPGRAENAADVPAAPTPFADERAVECTAASPPARRKATGTR
jgi:hypothetical protein